MDLVNKLLVATIPIIPRPIVRMFAGRYIAGEAISDAVGVVRRLNGEGAMATLDVLGEDINSREEADSEANDPFRPRCHPPKPSTRTSRSN